ncbi:sn-glycerol-3-phosphate import ATP-binding protein UgpC [Edwardsiella tarda]
MARLTLQNVSKSYDGRQAIIKGIDLDVQDGEFIVMVGPSGCGKSTLLRMVAGLEQTSGGDIYIGDERVTHKEPKDRGVAMVFQNYALYPHMTVAENMGYGLKIRGLGKQQIRQRVEEVAQILELEALLQRRPGELSGGQRQRVAMGRAIVREPAVFLFDEPLSNLDAKLRVQMRLELQQLHRRLKTTSLYVTHDQVEAMTLAQRVIVLNQGVAEQIGTPTEIYHRPASRFVAGFMGAPAMNLFDGQLAADGQTFQLTPTQQIHLQRPLPELAGQALTLGIRPEHLCRVDDEQPGNALTVETLELLGADNLAHGRWGTQSVTVRLPYQSLPAIGSVLRLGLPQANLHFFDPRSGRRITSPDQEPS